MVIIELVSLYLELLRNVLFRIISMLYFFYQHPDIDECASAPCQNGGTCVDQVNGYLCQCAPGYTDLQCQTGKESYSKIFSECVHISSPLPPVVTYVLLVLSMSQPRFYTYICFIRSAFVSM